MLESECEAIAVRVTEAGFRPAAMHSDATALSGDPLGDTRRAVRAVVVDDEDVGPRHLAPHAGRTTSTLPTS